jgi:RimJ/RimL family protein N-acetyltransferase
VAERVILRPATTGDCERVHAWANDPVTRAVSFSSAAIPYAEHVEWFEQQLRRADRNLLIAEADGLAIAVVRLDRAPEHERECIISLNVAPEARGRGLGVATLQAASPYAARLGFVRIRALVRPDNAASVRAFARAGYVEATPTRVDDQAARLFIAEV